METNLDESPEYIELQKRYDEIDKNMEIARGYKINIEAIFSFENDENDEFLYNLIDEKSNIYGFKNMINSLKDLENILKIWFWCNLYKINPSVTLLKPNFMYIGSWYSEYDNMKKHIFESNAEIIKNNLKVTIII